MVIEFLLANMSNASKSRLGPDTTIDLTNLILGADRDSDTTSHIFA
jgi:hypothetical protein